MKAVVAAFNQEKALVGAFSVITNLRMELFGALVTGEGDSWSWDCFWDLRRPGWAGCCLFCLMHTLHICSELRYAQEISLAAASAGVSVKCGLSTVVLLRRSRELSNSANQRLGNFGPAGRDIFKSWRFLFRIIWDLRGKWMLAVVLQLRASTMYHFTAGVGRWPTAGAWILITSRALLAGKSNRITQPPEVWLRVFFPSPCTMSAAESARKIQTGW